MSKLIDVVVTWVDERDPKWLAEKQQYAPDNMLMNSADRFRDWDNLQYLFRAFERFIPWVNKIHFVTYGHLPKWLNTDHPKLNVVNHRDFLRAENLPLFNINAIEVNFHRIPGLAEKFIYFNDDMFILNPMRDVDFFRNDLPVNAAICNVMHEGVIAPIILNDIDLLNKNFNRHVGERLTKRGIMKQNILKWFSPKYGKGLINNLLLLYWKTFTGFVNYHHPQPFLKSTFQEVWEREPDALSKVSCNKFRDNTDVNQYLFRYWQFATGNFSPDSYQNAFKRRRYVELRSVSDAETAAHEISTKKFQMYCVNDSMSKGRFTPVGASEEELKKSIQLIKNALETVLPTPSDFELKS